MRAFLLLFIAAWVGGVVLGAVEASRAILGVVTLGFAGWLTQRHWRAPHIAAAASLLAVGWFWGQLPREVATTPSCARAPQVIGSIAHVHQRTGTNAQYVITDEHGCTLLLTIARFPEYAIGTKLRLVGELEPLADIPAEYEGYGKYLARRGIAATMLYPEAQVVAESEAMPPLADRVRTRLRTQIERTFAEPEGSVVAAMLLGEAGVMPDDIDTQFRRTGITHVVAISGSHISLFVGLALIVLYLLPLSVWWRTGLLLALVWGYISLVGYLPSAMRAAIFWTIAVVALQIRSLVSLPTLVILTAAVMVSIQPAVIFDVGFQLSIVAVAGIGLILFLLRRHWLQEAANKSFVSNVAVVSLGATLTTWPLVAYYFGNIPFLGIVANILVVPAVPLFMALALLATLVSFVWPLAALLLGFGVHILWLWIEVVTRILAHVPGAVMEDVSLPFWILPFYYLALVVVSTLFLLRNRRTWREVWE